MIGARKRVTVLFADLSGSTRLAERLGAEPWHEVLDRFLGLLTEQVHRFEGTVNQYTGDGIMALFGAPIAHEDHAQRACLAALAMQEAVHRYAQELRLRLGVHLLMRVGLHSGEVVVGSIGDDLRMDYTAQGLTVHLAARMESICEPGSVYLTQHTAALVQGYAELKDLGDTEVAGLSQPVRVFQLLRAGSEHTRLDRALSRGAAHFIGRGAELETLQAQLPRGRSGGAVVAVSGDAGIGKSRLCHEFAAHCERRSLRVLRAHGVPYGRAFPLLPVQTLLRQRLGMRDGESSEALRQRVAGALALYDPQALRWTDCAIQFAGGQLHGDIGEVDLRASEAFFCDFLLAGSAPQLLLIEDLHFVDDASRAVIEQLCARVGDTQSLLLLNFRSDADMAWLQPYLRTSLPLQPLGPRDLAELAAALVGGGEDTSALRAELVQRTQGNPFFLEEAVQALIEGGHLDGHRGAYQVRRPIAEWPIPDTVHALIASRIDRLPALPKRWLQLAAVIGQEFDARWIERLDESPESASGWEPLERSGFVLRHADAEFQRYSFANPLTREVAYSEQLEGQRKTAHTRVAGLLEDEVTASANAELAGQIAMHWLRGGRTRAAGLWSLQAGHNISPLSKPLEAVFWYRQALEQLQDVAHEAEVLRARIAAHAGLIRLAQLTGQLTREEVDAHFENARALCLTLGEEVFEIEVLISYATEQLHRGDARHSVKLAEEALERASRANAAHLVDRFRLTLLLSFNAVGRLDEGLRRISAAGGDAWVLGPINASNYRSRGFRGVMLIMLGELAAAEAQLSEALAVSEQLGRPEGWLHAMLVDLAWFRGDDTRVMYHAQRAMEQAEASESAYFRALATRSLGVAHNLSGSPSQALPLLEAARATVRAGSPAHHLEGSFLAVLAESYHAAGDLRRAARVAARAVASARRSGSRLWELRAWVSLLALPADASRQARVESSLRRAFQLCDSIQADGIRPHLHLARARWTDDAGLRAEELERARAAFARIGAHGHLRRLAAA